MGLLTALSWVSIQANEVTQATENKPKSQNDNTMRRGPQKAKETMEEVTPVQLYEYDNRISIFIPWHQTYERTKPDCFYWAAEGWVLPALNEKAKVDLIGEAEIRFGYNFFWNGRDHFTPLVGIGYFQDIRRDNDNGWVWVGDYWDKEKNHKTHHGGVLYGTVGFLYNYEVNDWFEIGTNLKGLFGGGVGKEAHHRHNTRWGTPVFGVDFALPITFRFGPKRHWDIRLEPFDIYLHGHERGTDSENHHKSRRNHNFFGGRSTVGYRF